MAEYLDNQPQNYEDADDGLDIDLMAILAKLLKKWKQIVLIGFIFGCLGVVSALMMKRQYSVTLTLAPELASRGSGNLSSITSMLGLGNVSMGTTTDAMSIALFPEICNSTPFLASLFDVPLSTYVSPQQAEEGVKPMQTTVYKHFSGEDKPQKKGLFSRKKKDEDEEPYTGVKDPTELPRKQAGVVKVLRQSISANVDKKTGMTTISVTGDDRMIVKQLADTVCTRLQQYVSAYRTQKAQANYDYYCTLADEAHEDLVKAQAAYARSVDYDRSVILQSASAEKDRLREEVSLANQIYSQMAQQRELARAKIQEDKPVYAIIQPAVLPQRPVNSRAKRVLIWGLMGGVLAVAWYGFGEDFFKKMRSSVKEQTEDNQE